MSTEVFENKLSSAVFKQIPNTTVVSNPKMSQIFYCHQEQWIQYFATARNIPDSMVSYPPSTENLKQVVKGMTVSKGNGDKISKDDADKVQKKFPKAQLKSRVFYKKQDN